MKAAYLVAYDIASPKRLSRVARCLGKVGIRIQYSVFWVTLTWPQLGQLKSDLTGLIHAGEDDIRIYPLPAKPRVTLMGRAKPFPDGVQLYSEGSSLDWMNEPSATNTQHDDREEVKDADWMSG